MEIILQMVNIVLTALAVYLLLRKKGEIQAELTPEESAVADKMAAALEKAWNAGLEQILAYDEKAARKGVSRDE